MTLSPELEAVAISAAVSLAIVLLKEFWFDPLRKERSDKVLRKRLLNVWVANLNDNLDMLGDEERALDGLTVDQRPLDILALPHEELVDELSNLRSRIFDYNRSLDIYHAAGVRYLSRLQRVTPLDPRDDRDEIGGLKWWMGDSANRLRNRRMDLQSRIHSAQESLKRAIARENDC